MIGDGVSVRGALHSSAGHAYLRTQVTEFGLLHQELEHLQTQHQVFSQVVLVVLAIPKAKGALGSTPTEQPLVTHRVNSWLSTTRPS